MTGITLLYCPPLQRSERPLLSLTDNFTPVTLPLSAAQQAEAQQLVTLWQQHRVSRYNRYPDPVNLPARYMLLILQPHQSAAHQQQLLQYAAAKASEHSPDCVVLICHEQHQPIATTLLINSLCTVIIRLAENVHHALLLANSAAVITHDSWLGFEALLWQKSVFTFGLAWYAGLGLTTDLVCNGGLAARPVLTIAQLVHQLLLTHSQAIDIETNTSANAAAAITWLGLQRQQRSRFASRVYAIGFNYHWRATVKAFLHGSEVVFVKQAAQVPVGAHAIVWGRRDISDKLAENISLIRLEDGFLRSVGLGAQFVKPLSWVADDKGLYFDATATSALEQLLAVHPLNEPLQQRAKLLVKQLVQHGISKYNTGQQHWQRPLTRKKIILVPGQVESDASIKYGAPAINTNIALLQAVRSTNPAAYIIYKPHPDVQAGARAAGINEHNASQFCDQLADNVNIAVLLENSDEVHVLTSLAGFEALLRGKIVHCYGLPFYAGWGLTLDYCVSERRQRKLNLMQLVAASLLLYPLYISNRTGYYTTPEHTLRQLLHWRAQPLPFSQKCKNVIRLFISNILGAK